MQDCPDAQFCLPHSSCRGQCQLTMESQSFLHRSRTRYTALLQINQHLLSTCKHLACLSWLLEGKKTPPLWFKNENITLSATWQFWSMLTP